MDRMRSLQSALAVLAVCALSLSLGCGGGSAKGTMARVKGTASFDGKPIEDGMVYLKSPDKGTVSSLPIKNGTFEGDAEVGSMRVEIAAYRSVTPQTDMADYVPEPTKENFLPAKFHSASTMTSDVKADGSTVLTYDLKSE
jgi:hypothetical protein